jgi:hypothetical protein
MPAVASWMYKTRHQLCRILDLGGTSTSELKCTVDFTLNGVSGGDTFIEKNTITPINSVTPCPSVKATLTQLWPANHKFVTVGLTGATDALHHRSHAELTLEWHRGWRQVQTLLGSAACVTRYN